MIDTPYKPELKIFVDPRAEPDVYLPRYMSEGAAGFDVCAFTAGQTIALRPNERRVFETGLTVIVPEGYELQVRPRSGLAIKHGVTVVNSPGTIDSDYRGRLMVGLINLSGSIYRVEDADRIAQCVLAPVTIPNIQRIHSVNPFETARGTGGFGSTGK